MKKIGILVYDTSLVGGAERVAINLAQELSKNYETHLISLFNEKGKNDTCRVEYKTYTISEKTVRITTNLIRLSKKLKGYLLQNEIDILLCITAGVNTVAIMATCKTKIKTVYCEHSNLENKSYGKKHQIRQYLGAKYMTKVITLTERDRNNFIKDFNVPENKVKCITNWFTPTTHNSRPYKDDSKKIITVGRLEKVKGHDLLIKVAKKVRDKHNDWTWDIYGDGKFKDTIEKNIIENGVKDFVFLKGNVNNLNDIYSEYAFFVLTSYYEGIPLVLLEAQESKLPVVSFDCPTGPAEIIEHNINGFIIPTYNIDKMAEKICELIENKNKRIQFSNNAKINLKNFDKKNIIQKWIDLIENI